MDSKLWFREIMSLKIPNLLHKDLSKILLIFYLVKENGFNKEISILNFNKYVYRFYIDNPKLAEMHPSVIVNSLSHYGVKDLILFTKQALEEWKNDFNDGCLSYNESYFKVLVNDIDDEKIKYTLDIANMLYMKATGYQFDYSEEIEKFDKYELDSINKSRLKNRVYEDMQYCVCCDYLYDLNIVNISNNLDFLNDKYNYVTVCKKHYELFINGYFSFNSYGYINIIKPNKFLNSKMHISNSILNERRKKILNEK